MPAIHTYTEPECVAFAENICDDALVYHYHGRYGFEGPAANFDSMAEATDALISAHYRLGYDAGYADGDPDSEVEVSRVDSIRVQFDSMGLGVVMYTRQKDAGEFVEDHDNDDY